MKRKIILSGLIIGSVMLSGCNSTNSSTVAQAGVALSEGDYENAKILYQRSLAEDTDREGAYRGMGLASLNLRDYDTAIECFENALHESNGIIKDIDIDISYYLAVAMHKAGKVDDAIKVLDSVIAIRPASDTAYYMRGKIRLIGKDESGAKADYDKAIEIAPTNYDHYLRISEDLKSAGYDEDSRMYVDRAISAGGKMPDAVKGVFEYCSGSYTDARNDLEKARKSSDSETVSLYLGRTYEALGDLDYAIGIYQEAITKFPDSGKLYNQLAVTKLNGKDYNGAIEVIENGILNGNGESMQSLLYNRVVAYENVYDFDTATKYMKEYIEKYPDDANAQREYLFLSTR